MDLLYQVIGSSVQFYHKKIKYPLKGTPRKISVVLGQSMVRSRILKGGLGLSRMKEEEKKEETDNEKEEEENESSDDNDSNDEEDKGEKISEEE